MTGKATDNFTSSVASDITNTFVWLDTSWDSAALCELDHDFGDDAVCEFRGRVCQMLSCSFYD